MSARARVQDAAAEHGLPWPPIAPTHEFLPVSAVGSMLYVSGHAPYAADGFQFVGAVGADLDLESGQQAARLAALGCLVSVERHVGTLDAIERVIKVNGYVRADAAYQLLPRITDAASRLLIDAFGESRGRHARTTVGVASLPAGVSVELEMIVLATTC